MAKVIDFATAAAEVEQRKADNGRLIAQAKYGMMKQRGLATLPTSHALAHAIGVHPNRISEYLKGRNIGAEARERLTAFAKGVR